MSSITERRISAKFTITDLSSKSYFIVPTLAYIKSDRSGPGHNIIAHSVAPSTGRRTPTGTPLVHFSLLQVHIGWEIPNIRKIMEKVPGHDWHRSRNVLSFLISNGFGDGDVFLVREISNIVGIFFIDHQRSRLRLEKYFQNGGFRHEGVTQVLLAFSKDSVYSLVFESLFQNVGGHFKI